MISICLSKRRETEREKENKDNGFFLCYFHHLLPHFALIIEKVFQIILLIQKLELTNDGKEKFFVKSD